MPKRISDFLWHTSEYLFWRTVSYATKRTYTA